MNKITDEFISQIKSIVGEDGYSINAEEIAPFLNDSSFAYSGESPLLVQPKTAEETAAVVKLCHDNNVGIVPVGGRTGLVGGGVPFGQILISTARMNNIVEVDVDNFTLTVEAGCTLAGVRIAADEAGLMFPLSMPSEKDSQIGGNIATNMGGTNFLQYGGARENLMGLEVVLPDGRIWNGLRKLEKDNTGYDLKQLFVGSEGTLGIVTKAVLKMKLKPVDVQVAVLGFNDVEGVTALLNSAKAESGDNVTAFELMPRQGIENVLGVSDEFSDVFDEDYDWYVLVEMSSANPSANLSEAMNAFVSGAQDKHLIQNAVVAEDKAKADYLWKMRNTLPSTIYQKGGASVFDVSVPVSSVPEFIKQATAIVMEKLPEALITPFGHVGDGNIHFSVNNVKDAPAGTIKAEAAEITKQIHSLVVKMSGSISAEHGIGCLKKDELAEYHADVEIDLMRKIKTALDTKNIMNPGKLVDV